MSGNWGKVAELKKEFKNRRFAGELLPCPGNELRLARTELRHRGALKTRNETAQARRFVRFLRRRQTEISP